MRDLYNRLKRLADWIKRVNEDVDEPDRTDILKLIEYMQDKERAILWIIRCITALITLRKHLGRPFRNATKEDMRLLLKSTDELKKLYESKGISPDKEIIAYCRIGERSSHTWFVLKYLLGYPDVKNYDGSWTEWGNIIANPIEK
jgi:rhodanese-related sulfurtransferase